MALSAFDDKATEPAPAELRKTLGRAGNHWDALETHLAAAYPPLDQTWNFAGAKWGWSLRMKQKKRTVLYMTPLRGRFLVGFVLGEKAVRAAHEADLPAATLSMIDGATKYAEGRGVRVEVKSKRALQTVKTLAATKMAN
jgi:hypothetical protein